MTKEGTTQATLGGSADPDGGESAAAAAAREVAGDGGANAEITDPAARRYPDADSTVEIAVTQVDYTIEGSGRDETPIIHVFGRTDEDEVEHVRVHEFRPYFYVPSKSLDEDDDRLDHDRITGWEETAADGDPYESIRGESLTKIFGQTPRDVGQIRDRFDHYEADVLFPNRFLIDKDVTSGLRVPDRRASDDAIVVPHDEADPIEMQAETRVCTFDIEVDDRSGFPEDGEETIVCLSSHDSYRDEYAVWLYEAPGGTAGPEELTNYEAIDGGGANGGDGADGNEVDADVHRFDTEEAMLAAFLDYIEETDPDVTTGWNFTDFDAPYFIDRLEELGGAGCEEHDLDPDRLSRVNEVWRSDWQGPNVKGRVVFDLLYAYQRTQFTELDSYRLDAVGEVELGVGKERYPGDIGDLWEDDPERLLEYNLRDVELCVEIDRQQGVVPFWQEVASFVGCKLEDATTPGDAVDMYVLHEAHGEFVLPSKGQQETEDFEGGAVFDPITGVKEMVSVLDLKCFSGDTELVTPAGIRNIQELSVGDPVYTLNPETFECEIKPVVDTQSYRNQYGELHHVEGNTHDLKVTENHRFLVSNTRGWDSLGPEDYDLREYRDIPDANRFAFPNHEPMAGAAADEFRLYEEVDDAHAVVYAHDGLTSFRAAMPTAIESSLDWANGTSMLAATAEKTGKYLLPIDTYRAHREVIDEHADEVFLKYDRGHQEMPLSIGMDDWLELVGWFVTKGSFIRETPGIVLHQQDEEGRAAIHDLLERVGLNYSVDGNGFYLSNRVLHDWFRDNCGEDYANKRVPEWVFELEAAHLEGLLETLILGDGSRAESGLGKFWTKSDQLKEDITRLAVQCGHKPTVSKQSDGTWYVSIGKRGSFEKRDNATVEDHDGDVHCITAKDNHVVLAGRNGRFQWVGQSLYPMSMVTINASPETQVDPAIYEGETYQTPTGIHFRKSPDGIIREMVDELLTEREEKKARRDDHTPATGEYQRFDRQQQAVKVIMNCFTPDTEVLTPGGVRDITDLAVGDEVYSLDPDTEKMEVKPVVETHAYPEYDGELVDIETSKTDFRVTPNHRMLVRKNETNGITEDDYRFVEAGDLDRATNYELPHDWSGPDGDSLDEVDLTALVDGEYEVWVRPSIHGHTFTAELGWTPRRVPKNDIGETGYVFTAEEFEAHREYIEGVCETSYVHRESGRKWIPRVYDGDDFLDLLAWYITEGNVYTSTEKTFGENVRGPSTTVKIAQDAPAIPDGGPTDTHATIGELLGRMGFDHSTDERCHQFTSKLLGEALVERCGGDSFEKGIPDLVWTLDERQKRRFLETLVDGDGDRQPNSWRYTTSSERLRDDVLKLCAHLGLTASYNRDSGSWRVYVTEDAKNSLRMHRSGGRSSADDGVYCVTVADNHTLLAGRNGKFQFVGQSLYGVFGWDRFRLYDRAMSAGVTSTNREVIDFTEHAANEMSYDVAYGDSITGDRPVVVRDPNRTVRVLPIERLFGQGDPTATGAGQIAADGGSVASATPGKDRRSLDGWDALSVTDDGEAEWRPIERAIRHETEKPVVKLQHKIGESVTTRDHSYVVEDGDELADAPPSDVEDPLRVPELPDVETAEAVDIYDVLRGYTREYEDGRGVGSEQATTKVKRVHADDEHVWFGHAHHGDLDSTVKVKRHVDLGDEDGRALVRLLAAYVTEGSASTIETMDEKFGATIAESRREWLEQLESDYHRLFENTTAGIIASDARDERTIADDVSGNETNITDDDRTLKLQMMNELAAVFFREFAGQTSREKRIPSFVFHLPEPEQTLFLDWLVEGDGSREFPRYSDEYAERHFDYETVGRRLAAGLSTLLTQRGQNHSLKYRDSKDSYTIRTCEYYRPGREPVRTEVEHDGYVYDLSVETNENFVDAVGGIVLHNTDSVMIELGADTAKGEAIEQAFGIADHINEAYDEFARETLNADDHRFQIEFEKLYRRFFQAGKKKRYAGHIVWKEGKDVDDVDITGFEYKRSDIAPITKRVQHEVIDRIVHGEDLDAVKTYLRDVIDRFEDGDVDIEEVGVPGGIGKRLDDYDTDTAQVRGAKFANLLLGTNFQRGSKPKRLYLDRVDDRFFRRLEAERPGVTDDPLYDEFRRDVSEGAGVICFEYADQIPEEFAVDWEKMLDKTLKGPIARVVEAVDISWEEVRSGQTQTGLGSFT